MSWIDRIKPAAYTSPTGTRLVFAYEDVSETVEKHTAAFDFPDAEGTLVQDLGRSGRRFPLRVIFHGEDCDTEARAFQVAILERGVGKLEHPMYGTVDVVPFGAITRNDALATAANQVTLTVQFWETIGVAFPAGQVDPAAEVAAAVEEYNKAAAAQFAATAELKSATAAARFRAAIDKLQQKAAKALGPIADTVGAVSAEFNAINSSISSAMDTLVHDPLSLAFQTVQMIQSPARAATVIGARLVAYGQLARAIFESVITPEFLASELYATTYTTGSVVSGINATFTNKTEAIAAADEILRQFDAAVAWRDTGYTEQQIVDTGEAYQRLQQAVALATGYLVSMSFDLAQEYRIVLDRDRQLIELTAELYGSVDDHLDAMINDNALTGSEVLLLPKDREIVYYL
ncbi:MAG: hypothetical protein GY767_22650 [Shimia sp.]|nr:hypothetical protein [Shimia sp.]